MRLCLKGIGPARGRPWQHGQFTGFSTVIVALKPYVLCMMQAELAAALLEEEWPDQKEAAAARAAAREAATPVPERVWALRNVGALPSGGLNHASQSARMHVMLVLHSIGHLTCLAWLIWRCGCLLQLALSRADVDSSYPRAAEA